MTRFIPMLLTAGFFAVSAGPSAADPKPELTLLYDLLHLDKTVLDPAMGDPLVEMQAVQNAYVELRDHAAKDTSPDRRFLKLFLFAGWAARQTNAFDTIEAFNSDLNPLFDKQPQEVLGILKVSDFLLPNTCKTLARHFFFEDANPDERQEFMRSHEADMQKVLGDEGAGNCAAAFWSVEK